MKILPHVLVALVVLSLSSPVMAQQLAFEVADLQPPMAELQPVAIARLPADDASEILGFERRRFTVQRVRGKVLIDNVLAPSDVVERRSKEIRMIEYFDGLKFSSSQDFRNWTKKLRKARTYTYDIVFLRDPNFGSQNTPLVLLPKVQRQKAELPWRQWLTSQRIAAERSRVAQQQADREERAYATLQKTAEQQAALLTQQTAIDNDRYLDRWRVFLSPANQTPYNSLHGTLATGFQTSGVRLATGGPAVLFQPARSTSVDLVATNSQLASQNALANYPNHRVVGIYKIRN